MTSTKGNARRQPGVPTSNSNVRESSQEFAGRQCLPIDSGDLVALPRGRLPHPVTVHVNPESAP